MLDRLIHGIDRWTTITGKTVSFLMVPLILAVVYEVMARYLFRAPTTWAFDVTYMLYSAVFMLGAGFALLRGAHIRTDMLWEKYSERKKGAVDSIAYILFFFPGLALLFWTSVDDAIYSFRLGERSDLTAWRPILWPFRAIVPLAALLLMIQGVSELLKSLYAVRTGRLYERKVGAEV
jgi:TRAP-type mannitol/chloroaromatic compound transport system permease small subunit